MKFKSELPAYFQPQTDRKCDLKPVKLTGTNEGKWETILWGMPSQSRQCLKTSQNAGAWFRTTIKRLWKSSLDKPVQEKGSRDAGIWWLSMEKKKQLACFCHWGHQCPPRVSDSFLLSNSYMWTASQGSPGFSGKNERPAQIIENRKTKEIRVRQEQKSM